MSLSDPIRVKLTFENLIADKDGGVFLKFALPASECAKAGLFPVMREIVFDAVFTPEGVVANKTHKM